MAATLMMSFEDRLLPRPQRLELGGAALELPAVAVIGLTSDDPVLHTAAVRLQGALAERGCRAQPRRIDAVADELIRLAIDPLLDQRSQSYRLRVTEGGIEVVGADAAGVLYGCSTLEQYLRQAFPDATASGRLPGLAVTDWPDLETRGVLLDISRDRVPTLQTLCELVDLLSGWRINQLQLYTEHTFAYLGHEIVWRAASPLKAEEIQQLDDYCRRRAVELVPNQNCLGHFHRWLTHDSYRPLAECPAGVRHPFSESLEPFSLCPIDPGALTLITDLLDQLLPNFSSRMVNVGLDETFDLGMGRSAPACAAKGKGRVFLDYLERLHALVSARGRRMQFWADMVMAEPWLASELPADTLPLEWGYEADHPFADRARILAAAGLEFYLCPGTSSWNSLAGRAHNAIANLSAAATAARGTGARGYLITDWGDFGHLQPLSVSYLGFLAGAACGWNTSTATDPLALELEIPELLDSHAFAAQASGLGRCALELGNAYRVLGAEVKNGTLLFHLLLRAHEPMTDSRFGSLEAAGLERALHLVEESRDRLAAIDPNEGHAALVQRELSWVAGLLAFSCRLGLERLKSGRERTTAELPAAARKRLHQELGPLVEEYAPLWRARSRSGGYTDSLSRLERIAHLLVQAG